MRLIDADAAILDARANYGWVHDAVLMERFLNFQPTIAVPPNGPLTLDELREMDGEPVWVQYGQYDGEWLIVAWNIYDAISYARKAPFKLSVYSYGDTWLAYHRKPEEV